MSSDSVRRVGVLSYDRKKVIGRGNCTVFSDLEVKRTLRDFKDSSPSISEEKKIISKIGNHQEKEKDENFEYFDACTAYIAGFLDALNELNACLYELKAQGKVGVVTEVKTNDKIELGFYRKSILGRGGHGRVYAGMFTGKLVVAVKRIECTDPNEGEKIFQREIEPMKELTHANIVHFLAYTADLDFLYIVTELCKGTLKDWIAGTLEYDGPKIKDERKILHQVTQELAYLHQNKIIHRDIKPTNILIYVDDEGSEPLMKLADFGTCSILSVDNGFTNTNMNNPSGSPGYRAPEMFENKVLDNKVDIFALGCVFCCTLSTGGKHPFGDDEVTRSYMIKEKKPMVLKHNHLNGPYYSVDEFIFELIHSMVNVNPKERPTAAEILKNPFFKPLNDLKLYH